MKKTACCLILILAALVAVKAEDTAKPPQEQGRFLILYRSQLVGYEEYKLFKDSAGTLALHSECAFLLPKGSGNTRFAYKIDLTMDSAYTPLRFDELFLINEMENYLHVQFRDGKSSDEAYLGGQMLNRSATVHPHFSILEESVYALYAMMYRKYQSAGSKTDKTQLWLYIPKTGIEIPAQFTFANDVVWGDLKLRRYLLDVGRFQGVALDVDDNGRLMRLFIARQDLEIIRDLEYDRNPATPAPIFNPPAEQAPTGTPSPESTVKPPPVVINPDLSPAPAPPPANQTTPPPSPPAKPKQDPPPSGEKK